MDNEIINLNFWQEVLEDIRRNDENSRFLCYMSAAFKVAWLDFNARRIIYKLANDFLNSEVGRKYRDDFKCGTNIPRDLEFLFNGIPRKFSEFGVLHRQVRIDFVNWVMSTL